MTSVVLETSLGDIQLELYWDHAPRVSVNHAFPCPHRANQRRRVKTLQS